MKTLLSGKLHEPYPGDRNHLRRRRVGLDQGQEGLCQYLDYRRTIRWKWWWTEERIFDCRKRGERMGSRGRGQRSRGPRAFFYQTRENQVQRCQYTCKSNTASRRSPTIRKKAEQNGMRITQSIYCNMGMENNCTDDATNQNSKNVSKEVRSAKASTQDTVFDCLQRNRRAARVLWEIVLSGDMPMTS